MDTTYLNLVKSFDVLDIDEKREVMINDMNELFELLNDINNSNDNNTPLPILSEYVDESSFYTLLYTYIISIKEESAKLIELKDNN